MAEDMGIGDGANMNDLINMFLESQGEERRKIEREFERIRPLKNKLELVDSLIKSSKVEELRKDIGSIQRQENRRRFIEAGRFEDFASYRYFYDVGGFLDEHIGGSLDLLLAVSESVENFRYLNDPIDFVEQKGATFVSSAADDSMKFLSGNILGFENLTDKVFRRGLDQFRYLQKRFNDIGGDETKVYRDEFDNRNSGFDLKRLQHVKTELVDSNPLLTDLLLDMIDVIPSERTKMEAPKKGKKKKPVEKKFIDDFDVERFTGVMSELSDKRYQSFVREPETFLRKVGEEVKHFHRIASKLEDTIRSVITDPRIRSNVPRNILYEDIIDPTSVMNKFESLDYNSVQPTEEDKRPRGTVEKRFFAARMKLMNHLNEAMKNFENTENFEGLKEDARTAIKLKAAMEKTLQTRAKSKLKQDKRDENYFYKGSGEGQLGQFHFVREPAPDVKMSDVIGRSFDTMKEHLEDLGEYSKFMNLYTATSPRGKIKSNLLAIGPYGCGKTEIARAIGGDKRFIGAEVSMSDLLTAWFGEFEKNMGRIWDGARDIRRENGDNKLMFLLLDEFDSFFTNSDGHWVSETHDRAQKIIQQKLDGMIDYEGIISVGLTNEPAKIPLAIYRRFKYVDIVGELEEDERSFLLKKFLKNGLPLSSGFRQSHYDNWAREMEGATGDVIGKVADDIHYGFMRDFVADHPKEGRKLERQIHRMYEKNGEIDMPFVKRTIGQHMKVNPDMVGQALSAKLAEPTVIEQIDTAKRVYREARETMEKLHEREDVATGNVGNGDQKFEYGGL